MKRIAGAVLALAAALAAVLAPVTAAGAATPPPVQPGGFTAVAPARILDTRTGLGAPAAKVGEGQTLELQVTGRGGVPASGVSAVALNLTVTEPTTAGYLTAFPTGQSRPLASSANFAAGQTVANAVSVKVGTGGKVSIFNSNGTSHLVADVSGWHASTGGVGANFTSVTPVRVFDSRVGQPLAPGAAVTVAVRNGVTAVALNVTATEPTTASHLTVYPAGTVRPLASSLNMGPGQTRANFVAVKVANGAVDIYNASGTTHVVVDLMGYWSSDSYGRMTPVTPARILDTRTGFGYAGGAGRRGPDSTFGFAVPAHTGVPKGRTAAVVLNVTVTEPTSAGHLTLYPSGEARPIASNVNFAPGETVPNLVIVPLGYEEYVTFHNQAGYTHVIIDVVGWFDLPGDRIDMSGLSTFGSDVAIDPTSTYAYISRTGANRVEVMRLADGGFEDPILVGSAPTGLDLTPDGSRLYVANTGSVFVSVVDVATRTELRRFPVPSGSASDRPYSIAVLTNGKALITTTFNGTGMGGRLYAVDLATDTVTPRTDFSASGALTEASVIRASGDRKSAVVVEGNSSDGRVLRYDATTDTIAGVGSGEYIDSVGVNHDGSVILVNGGGLVYDDDLNLLGSTTGCGEYGAALNAAGTMGYGLSWDFEDDLAIVAFCDPVRFRVTETYSVGSAANVGRLVLSPDGTTLVGITDSGVLRFRL